MDPARGTKMVSSAIEENTVLVCKTSVLCWQRSGAKICQWFTKGAAVRKGVGRSFSRLSVLKQSCTILSWFLFCQLLQRGPPDGGKTLLLFHNNCVAAMDRLRRQQVQGEGQGEGLSEKSSASVVDSFIGDPVSEGAFLAAMQSNEVDFEEVPSEVPFFEY